MLRAALTHTALMMINKNLSMPLTLLSTAALRRGSFFPHSWVVLSLFASLQILGRAGRSLPSSFPPLFIVSLSFLSLFLCVALYSSFLPRRSLSGK